LRERTADIEGLSSQFLARFAREIGKGPLRLSDEALAVLRAYDWPGNVRELRNLMERTAVLSAEGIVTDRFFRTMIHPRETPQVEDRTIVVETEPSATDLS
jgi:DNA-binding NtrC family response regulator